MSDVTFNYNGNWFVPRDKQDSELLQQYGFIPGFKELLMLRQVHALEHATIWMLGSLKNHQSFGDTNDDTNIGRLSTERGFFLYGKVNPLQLKKAVKIALTRLQRGEWNLALHPRCGTNASVETLLTTGMILSTHLALPKEPIAQLLGLSVAGLAASCIAPEIGMSAQKYLTTAIPFNLQIQEIDKTIDRWGRPAHFIHLKWQNL